MRRNSTHTLVFGLALAYASLPACTSLTEVDWSRIPPPEVAGSGGSAGNAGTETGGNAGNATQAGSAAGTQHTAGSANEAGSPTGGADDVTSGEMAGAGGA